MLLRARYHCDPGDFTEDELADAIAVYQLENRLKRPQTDQELLALQAAQNLAETERLRAEAKRLGV